VVRAGFAVPVDEGLIALQGLDPRPGILARHARREFAARLLCARMSVRKTGQPAVVVDDDGVVVV
jgi:hypothetical protein